jgi:ABC-type phosphate/phosphonate transport system ATPase subunit
MVERNRELAALQGLLRRYPVVGIIGVRLVGKTTLARALASRTTIPITYFDLENPEDTALMSSTREIRPFRWQKRCGPVPCPVSLTTCSRSAKGVRQVGRDQWVTGTQRHGA